MKKLFIVSMLLIISLSLASCAKPKTEGFNESIMHAFGMFESGKTNLNVTEVSYIYYGADYEGERVVFYVFAVTYTEGTQNTEKYALLITEKVGSDLGFKEQYHISKENMMTNYKGYANVFKTNPLKLPYTNTGYYSSKLTARQVADYFERATKN